MTQQDTTKIICDIVAEQLELAHGQITHETKFDELGADSLDAIEIVMAVEDEFNIQIPDEQIDNFQTVGQLIDYVKSVVAPDSTTPTV